MKSSLAFILSKRPVLCLAFCSLILYILSIMPSIFPLEPQEPNRTERFYVEVVKPDGFPVLVELDGDSDLERMVSLYGLPRKPKNGDRLILGDHGRIEFSRISGRKSLSLGVRIGINSGSVEDLVALPGIGTVLAKGIIEYRESNKGFKSIDELERVKGIGKKRLEAIRPFVSLD